MCIFLMHAHEVVDGIDRDFPLKIYSSGMESTKMEKKPLPIHIRRLTRHAEFARLLDIQKAAWRHDDIDLTPTHQFSITSRMGAILLGAYIGGELAGFVYSFPALFHNRLGQHSHLLAVLPDFQGLGIGKKLKWAQRRWAMKLGYDLITWTFDPLVARNANLNLHTLGATTRTYWQNFYGTTSSLTHDLNIPTDRFLIEWPIRTSQVESRRQEKFERYEENRLPRALERKSAAADSLPGKARLALGDKIILVEVPREIHASRRTRDLIIAWQGAFRRVMTNYFKRGYAAVDFIYGDRCFYVLRKHA
ncbi:MAG: GNAT family N-acetyltransferase [Candidatus Aminicenantes bacterium]|nr:GNAT family N-acetyltransferase [Candidatus Aminicenantes bacterium]